MAKALFEALWNDPNAKIKYRGSPNEKAMKQITPNQRVRPKLKIVEQKLFHEF